jgi:hypothetical protein
MRPPPIKSAPERPSTSTPTQGYQGQEQSRLQPNQQSASSNVRGNNNADASLNASADDEKSMLLLLSILFL